MKRNKKLIIRIVSFLMITLLVFQVILTSIDSCDDNKNILHKENMLLTASIYHNKILNIGRENQKYPILKAPLRSYTLYTPKIYQENDSDIECFYELKIDNRKIIRQSIQNYFNGSKYKYNRLAI